MKNKINYRCLKNIIYLNIFPIFFINSCANKNTEQSKSNSNSQASPVEENLAEIKIPDIKIKIDSNENVINPERDDIDEDIEDENLESIEKYGEIENELNGEENKAIKNILQNAIEKELGVNNSNSLEMLPISLASQENSEPKSFSSNNNLEPALPKYDNGQNTSPKNANSTNNLKHSNKLYPILEDNVETQILLEEETNGDKNIKKSDKLASKKSFKRFAEKFRQKLKNRGTKQEDNSIDEYQQRKKQEDNSILHTQLESFSNTDSSNEVKHNYNETGMFSQTLPELKLVENFDSLQAENMPVPSAPQEDDNLITYEQVEKLLKKEALINKLNSTKGLFLKVWSLCSDSENMKNSTLFDNGFHKIPLAFGIYNFNNSQIPLSEDEYNIIKENLFLKDFENNITRKLSEKEKIFDSFVRCTNGVVPNNANFSNVFYLKNERKGSKKIKISSFVKINEMNQEISVLPNVFLKIPVKVSSQIEKHDLFDEFKHIFKVENLITKEKYKYLTSKYNGKYKNNENVEIFIQRVFLTDKEGNKVTFLPSEAKLESYINNLNSLLIGENKVLQNLVFFNLKSDVNYISNIFSKYFNENNLVFSGVKDYKQIFNNIQKNNSIGFLLKIDNKFASESHSPIAIEFEGIDSFGNPFISKIKDSKW
ncbi:hypothetical protein ACWNT8_08880 [Pigmentibacter ruber]